MIDPIFIPSPYGDIRLVQERALVTVTFPNGHKVAVIYSKSLRREVAGEIIIKAGYDLKKAMETRI
jgi:hypothetical protein